MLLTILKYHFSMQSARNKTVILTDFAVESKSDIVFITETWFSTVADSVLVEELSNPGFCIHSIPRLTGKGRGLCVIIRSSIIPPCSALRSYKSFEACELQMSTTDHAATFILLYRPPPNKKKNNSLPTCSCLNPTISSTVMHPIEVDLSSLETFTSISTRHLTNMSRPSKPHWNVEILSKLSIPLHIVITTPLTGSLSVLHHHLDQQAPLRVHTIPCRQSAPWLSLEFKRLKQARRRAERRCRKSRLTAH